MERLDFDLLFRWFVSLGIDDPVWDGSTFSRHLDRLLEGDVAAEFLATLPKVRRLLSSKHFSVDGSLIEAWASMKSSRPKDGDRTPSGHGGRNPSRDFRGERRTNATHGSSTDPDAPALPQGSGHGGDGPLPEPEPFGRGPAALAIVEHPPGQRGSTERSRAHPGAELKWRWLAAAN